MKFSTGLLAGTFIGGAYGLMTAKHSGQTTRKQLKSQFDALTTDILAVNASLTKLRQAAKVLADEGSHNATATIQELQQLLNDFNFQTQPQIKRVKDASEKLQKDLDPDNTTNHTQN